MPKLGRTRNFLSLLDSAHRPTLVGYFTRRNIFALAMVAILTTGVIYWLLDTTQTDAIELSQVTTEEFLMNSIQYEVRGHEIESLQRSLEAFRRALKFNRIEVVDPNGKPISNSGIDRSGKEPDSEIPIVSSTSEHHGEIRIWYSDERHAWATSARSALVGRIFVSGGFFLVLAIGYSLFFYFFMKRHLDEPLADLVEHMNSSQNALSKRVEVDLATRPQHPEPIPERLTRFKETHALGLSYSRLESRWVEADTERAIALSLERYQRSTLLEVLHLARITVAFADPDGEVQFIGTPIETAVGDLLRSARLSEDLILSSASKFNFSMQNMLFCGHESNYSLIVELEDAHARKWSLHKAVIDDRPAIIIREVTQERGLEQALLRSEKLKAIGTLSSSIAHDFNNTISTILVNIELIKTMIDNKEEVQEELFEGIESSANGIANRISGIRRLALDDDTRLETVDQRHRIKELERFIAPTLGPNIKLKVRIEDDTPILCNGDEFESCIINLLVNAKQAMKGRGNIWITARPAVEEDFWHMKAEETRYLAIDILDDGPGVPPEIANLIFDPFYSTRKLTDGTGLGLAQVQAFCLRAGGNVHLNRNKGQGASFTLLLPMGLREPERKTVDDRLQRTAANKLEVHILDDNKLLADTTARLLQRQNMDAYAYETLAEFKSAARRLDISGILLSDVHMPDCSFKDVIDFVGAHGQQLQLAFYSGNEESLVSINRRYPRFATILKPFQTEELVDFLNGVEKKSKSQSRKSKIPKAPTHSHAGLLH